MVLVSAAAGVATLFLVWRRRFGPARASAALAVAAIVAGFGIAQHPLFLPGLTIDQAAAGRSTLVAVVIGALAGLVVLVPSLVLLFDLFLRGRLDVVAGVAAPVLGATRGASAPRSSRIGALALACLLAGTGWMVFADAGWAHAAGVLCLFVFAASAVARCAVLPDGQGVDASMR
jgi:cytochrome d ubiquinol oxidase subunit II